MIKNHLTIDMYERPLQDFYNPCPSSKREECHSSLALELIALNNGESLGAQRHECVVACHVNELITAIQEMLILKRAQLLFSNGNVEHRHAISTLTLREQEVFILLAGVHSAKVIADKIGISSHTLNEHISNIYKKLSVRNRLACIKLYINN